MSFTVRNAKSPLALSFLFLITARKNTVAQNANLKN